MEQASPQPYRVAFERSGGFAGLHMTATLDSKNLPPEEARRLEENLAAAGFFSLPAKLPTAGGGADRARPPRPRRCSP
jgi:hypothetical protein